MIDNEKRKQCLELLEHRRSAAPLLLSEPGPDAEMLRQLLTLATRVPDHGRLEPWRLIVLQGEERAIVGERLTSAYKSENPDEEIDKVERQIIKITGPIQTAPVTVVVVSRADPEARKPEWEQILSAGAVCMNLLTAATIAGFAGVWLTGWAAYNGSAKQILGVHSHERIAGILHLGTESEKQKERSRPDLDNIVTTWHG